MSRLRPGSCEDLTVQAVLVWLLPLLVCKEAINSDRSWLELTRMTVQVHIRRLQLFFLATSLRKTTHVHYPKCAEQGSDRLYRCVSTGGARYFEGCKPLTLDIDKNLLFSKGSLNPLDVHRER